MTEAEQQDTGKSAIQRKISITEAKQHDTGKKHHGGKEMTKANQQDINEQHYSGIVATL